MYNVCIIHIYIYIHVCLSTLFLFNVASPT